MKKSAKTSGRRLAGLAICILIVAAFAATVQRLSIDTDILNALPRTEAVTRSARKVLTLSPAMRMIAVDLEAQQGPADPDALAAAGNRVAREMEESGLFARVGAESQAMAVPELANLASSHLPVLFDSADLARIDQEILSPGQVDASLEKALQNLGELSGIGWTGLIEKDPLRLGDRVLARLGRSAMAGDAGFFRGQLISRDNRHLLLPAEPRNNGAGMEPAKNLEEFFDSLRRKLASGALSRGKPLALHVVGAFQSALDNESVIREDTARAILLTTIGIALLLLVSFPRPYIGLLSLVPAIFGTMAGLVVYRFFHPGISAMALGFGGAIIAITMDCSIAYLLFMDRPVPSRAHDAAQNIFGIGLTAMLTTVGAFFALMLGDFPLMAQMGLFAGLGTIFSFLFIHLVFPLLIPELPGAGRKALLPLEGSLKKVMRTRRWGAFGLCASLMAVAVFFCTPRFRVDLAAVNTVSPRTLAAEETVKRVWGNVMGRSCALLEADSVEDLLDRTDPVALQWKKWLDMGFLANGLVPSMVIPGKGLAEKNFVAWKAFWTPEKIAELKKNLAAASARLGFVPDAFESFLDQVEKPRFSLPAMSAELQGLLGISPDPADGRPMAMLLATPGPAYDQDLFYETMTRAGAWVFEPRVYSEKLGSLLGRTFFQILAVLAAGVLLLLIVFLLDVRFILLALLPVTFAFVMTLATLNLLGLPVDIPCLMLAVVILGVGVDFGIFFVHSRQRFFDPDHPVFGPIYVSVFLSASSTLTGVGALALSRHAALRSAGLSSFLGVGYSLLGAFLLLPPIIERMFAARAGEDGPALAPGSPEHLRHARKRYALMEPYPRLFARFKMMLDPMFPDLYEWAPKSGMLLDAGCGYGVPAVWLRAASPELRFLALEPAPLKARVAANALGTAGKVLTLRAEDLPPGPEAEFSGALFLDVAHAMDDGELRLFLARLLPRLAPGGPLIMRATVSGKKARDARRTLETLRLRIKGLRPAYRSEEQTIAMLAEAGFRLELVRETAPGREETWFIARRSGRKGEGR